LTTIPTASAWCLFLTSGPSHSQSVKSDSLEYAWHKKVCNGTLTLKQARKAELVYKRANGSVGPWVRGPDLNYYDVRLGIGWALSEPAGLGIEALSAPIGTSKPRTKQSQAPCSAVRLGLTTNQLF
jgi:hypothetical protein